MLKRCAGRCAWLVGLCAGLSIAGSVSAETPAPAVTVDGDAQAGHVTVSWSAPTESEGPPVFQAQEAPTPAFDRATQVYQGTHTASVISGMPDGITYYRARYRTNGTWSEWSKPEKFEVAHPPAQNAFLLFGLGACIFIATATVIIQGNRRASHD